jgi:hypothetical protein
MKLRYSRALVSLLETDPLGAAGNAAFAHGRDASCVIEPEQESVSVKQPGKTGPVDRTGAAALF